MNTQLDDSMDAALRHVHTHLFSPKTNLIYDYLTDSIPADPLAHLPWPEEIAASFPNPCGWGTGMEDSMLNAGSLMEVLCLRHQLNGDSEAKQWANRLLDGMTLCATIHGTQGFVARSVSPRDGKSCYINSSRDQFTLCVYGAWRYWRTFSKTDPEGAEKARNLLESIASYCEQKICVQGHKDLLRLDGRIGLASGVVDIPVHEIMRLPMFFAAAWDVTGLKRWHERYLHFAIDGIEKNLALDENRPWWDIEFSQMQLSLALLSEVETDPKLKEKYRKAMLLSANLSERFFHPVLKQALARPGDWSEKNSVWRTLPMYAQSGSLPSPLSNALTLDYAYMNPRFPEPFRESQRLLQAAGNYMFTLLLSEDFSLSPDLVTGFSELLKRPDYNRNGSDGPVRLLHAYWLAKKRNVLP